MRNLAIRLLVAGAFSVSATHVCGCSSATASKDWGTLELHAALTDDDAHALDALVASFTATHEGVKVVNPVENTDHADPTSRLVANTPPDLVHTRSTRDMSSWVRFNQVDDLQSKLEPLDSLYDDRRWRDHLSPFILSQVTVRGHIYAVPLGVHRTNTLFYNTAVFAQYGLLPPKTWAEFYGAATTLESKGVSPLAVGLADGPSSARMLLEDIVAANGGAEGVRRLWSGEEPADSALLRTALDDLSKLLDHVNADRQTVTWKGACDEVMSGHAAMTIVGDWGKSYFDSKGWRAGVNFGSTPAPGTAGTFIASVDMFVLPAGAQNRATAIGFLKSVGSNDGQSIFNPPRGSTPPRTDALDPDGAPAGSYDAVAQQTFGDFMTGTAVATYPVPKSFGDGFDAAMATFAKERNAAPVTAFYAAHVAELKAE